MTMPHGLASGTWDETVTTEQIYGQNSILNGGGRGYFLDLIQKPALIWWVYLLEWSVNLIKMNFSDNFVWEE